MSLSKRVREGEREGEVEGERERERGRGREGEGERERERGKGGRDGEGESRLHAILFTITHDTITCPCVKCSARSSRLRAFKASSVLVTCLRTNSISERYHV